MSRELLLGQLDFLHANLTVYLRHFPADRHGWQPGPNFYPLIVLAGHLYGMPLSYLAALQGKPAEEIFALNEPINEGTTADLQRLLDEGVQAIKAAYAALSPLEYQRELRTPFATTTPEGHLLDLITHMYHHRAQLHNYLKGMGIAVDTDTIYAQ